MDYEKAYKEALEKARKLCTYTTTNFQSDLEDIFPELKESDNERIRKALIETLKYDAAEKCLNSFGINKFAAIAWLENQCDTNETINRNEFAQDVLRGAAINLITWIDYNAAEGNTCLSNMECKDITGALTSCNWDKIYEYMKKKLEKQEEKEL